jgi:hypothetical protein
MLRTLGTVIVVLLAFGTVACPPAPTSVVAPPPPEPEPWPREGPAQGMAWPEPPPSILAPFADTLRNIGWTPLAVRVGLPTDDTTHPPILVAAMHDDGTGGWILLRPDPLAPEGLEGWITVPFDAAPPLPLWFVRLGPAPEDVAVLAERPPAADSADSEPVPGAWRIAEGRTGPAAELLWETLEPPDTLAVADLEGTELTDVVTIRWYDVCPDPMAAPTGSGCPAGTPADRCASPEQEVGDPCLIVRVWRDGDGVPQTFRLQPRPGGGLSALGDPALDRVVGLLRISPCSRLDLRMMTVRRETGLLRAAGDGELIERMSCGPDPASVEPEPSPFVVLLEIPGGETVPSGEILDLRAPAHASPARWVDGYQLLVDLDGDGIRDWLWSESSDAGTRYVVTRGPGRGAVAGSLLVGPAGDVIDRLVVAPPGGRAVLSSLDWRPAPDPAAILGVLFTDAEGVPRTEQIAVPLEFR